MICLSCGSRDIGEQYDDTGDRDVGIAAGDTRPICRKCESTDVAEENE